MGSDPGGGKGLFSHKYSVRVNAFNHLVVEFERY